MKRLMLMIAGTARADALYGLRTGLSLSPDQFVIGGQMGLEAKLGLVDSADFKFTVGWRS